MEMSLTCEALNLCFLMPQTRSAGQKNIKKYNHYIAGATSQIPSNKYVITKDAYSFYYGYNRIVEIRKQRLFQLKKPLIIIYQYKMVAINSVKKPQEVSLSHSK